MKSNISAPFLIRATLRNLREIFNMRLLRSARNERSEKTTASKTTTKLFLSLHNELQNYRWPEFPFQIDFWTGNKCAQSNNELLYFKTG